MSTDNLYPIPVYTQRRGFIRVEDGATLGARAGVNLYDENGDLIPPENLDAPALIAAAIAAHRTEANAHPISSITNLQTSLDAKANDNAVVHLAGSETITGSKTFTAQQIIDGQALRVQNWGGAPGDGVVYFGNAATDNYIYKAGNQFLFRFGVSTANLDSAGTIWTGGNLAQPMTLNTTQTVTGSKSFEQLIRHVSPLSPATMDIGANPTGSGVDQSGFIYLRTPGDIWFGTNNAERGRIKADGSLRWGNEIQGTSANSYRHVFGNYGVFQRNDGSDWFLMVTNAGDQYGSWNSLRPMYFNLPTGNVTFGHSVQVNGNLNVTGRIDGNAQATARSRIFVKDGTDTGNPGGKVMNMYYLSGVYDGGVLQAYDYVAAIYKPIKFEASSWVWIENGVTTKMTLDSSVPARSLQINGGMRSYGSVAQLETEDRTSARGWTWYGTGDVFYLYNGSGNIMSMTPGGQLSPQTFTVNGAASSTLSGNGSGFQMNGAMYENGTTYNLAANGAVWVRNPRVFVQSGDPGAQASDGDLWFW